MFLISVTKSDKPEKKLKATFCKCKIKNDCKVSKQITSFQTKILFKRILFDYFY